MSPYGPSVAATLPNGMGRVGHTHRSNTANVLVRRGLGLCPRGGHTPIDRLLGRQGWATLPTLPLPKGSVGLGRVATELRFSEIDRSA